MERRSADDVVEIEQQLVMDLLAWNLRDECDPFPPRKKQKLESYCGRKQLQCKSQYQEREMEEAESGMNYSPMQIFLLFRQRKLAATLSVRTMRELIQLAFHHFPEGR